MYLNKSNKIILNINSDYGREGGIMGLWNSSQYYGHNKPEKILYYSYKT